MILLITMAYYTTPIRREVKKVCLQTIDTVHPNVPVLLYHHLLKPGDTKAFKNDDVISNVEDFENQMQVLYDNGYTAITTNDLYDFIKNHKNIPKKSVLITFDDGYESNYIYAYPVLKKFGFKATIFLITSYVKEKSDPVNFDQLQYMSKESIQKTSDVFEFGSHSDNLHYLVNPQASALVSEPIDKVEQDVIKSKTFINTATFAYPYGMYNNDIIKMLQNNQFKMAFTTKIGRTSRSTDVYKIPRYSIFSNTPLNEFKKMVGIYEF